MRLHHHRSNRGICMCADVLHEWENVFEPPQHKWHWFHSNLEYSLTLARSVFLSLFFFVWKCLSAITMVDPFSQQDGKICTLLHCSHHSIHTHTHARTLYLTAQYKHRVSPLIFSLYVPPIFLNQYIRKRKRARASEKLHTHTLREGLEEARCVYCKRERRKIVSSG